MTETLPVIYADEHLIAVHKPANLLVHRSDIDRHETRFAVQIVRDQCGRHVYPAHRLDKGTSGVLLFAFSPGVARQLAQAFETQQVEKTYRAIVRGHPEPSGLIDHPLARLTDSYAGPATAVDAQPAQTAWRRLATVELPYAVDRYPSSRYALLELHPYSGRRHQLRRHLKHIAHPIIGDSTYGKGRHNRFFQQHFGSQRLLLACTHLTLPHPISQQTLQLVAAPAPDFAAVVAALGWGNAIPDQPA